MVTFTDSGLHNGSFIMSEASGKRSRENAVLVAGQNLPAGTVLGRITSGGKYTAIAQGAGDGSGTAVAILINSTDATDADVPVAIMVRDCEVNFYQLSWGSESATEQATSVDQLALQGIICRERPEIAANAS